MRSSRGGSGHELPTANCLLPTLFTHHIYRRPRQEGLNIPCRLIQKPVDRMALQAERVGLTLSYDCPADLPVVFADPERITQVFINLIHNAIKFTPNGGRIHVSAFQNGQMVVFKVSDNGVGIAPKDINRIFERFYKGKNAGADSVGIGLALSKSVLNRENATVEVQSTVGVGTTFTIRFYRNII